MDSQLIFKTLAPYARSNKKKAIFQILDSFTPFLIIWILIYNYFNVLYISIPLVILNSFYLVRIFIIQHDCGHTSFFDKIKDKRLNTTFGWICSIFSLLPFSYWRESHQYHHRNNGKTESDFRNTGDVPFKTLFEYIQSTLLERSMYKLFRNPFVLFGIAPQYYIWIANRLPLIQIKEIDKKIKREQNIHTITILIVYVFGFLLLGIKFLIIQLAILYAFGWIAFWFFFVQHTHEESYHKESNSWNYLDAALKASTYKLPKLIQYLVGNINLHATHHISDLIPNYNLESATLKLKELGVEFTEITFLQSLKFIHCDIWDEEKEKFISFKEADKYIKKI